MQEGQAYGNQNTEIFSGSGQRGEYDSCENLLDMQSTLLKGMKEPEDGPGKKLFIRHSFSIQLADEGRLLRNRTENQAGMAD